MLHKTPVRDKPRAPEPCPEFPELVRMNYFHGQMLGPRDFVTEQTYHREKQRLINRCLLGYGVVCGLLLEAADDHERCEDDGPMRDERDRLDDEIGELEEQIAKIEAGGDEAERGKLEVALEEKQRRRESCGDGGPKSEHREPKLGLALTSGFALDTAGREMVVRERLSFELWSLLAESDRERLRKKNGAWVYVSICYAECGLEPTRPASLDNCQMTPGCKDARVRESYRLKVSLERPEEDERCEACCSGPDEACVLLGRVRLRRGRKLRPRYVDNSLRRPFGLYTPTVITGINWRHGDGYSPDEAERLLGTGCEEGGIEIRFSRSIHVSCFRPGVIELLTFAGGRGVAGQVTHITGKFVDLPQSGRVDRVVYRDTTDERPRPGDRILVIVRCDFRLDACCKPVDGNHLGGRVPSFAEGEHDHPQREPDCGPCETVPGRGGAFSSGNGRPGGSFESWFFIERDKESGV